MFKSASIVSTKGTITFNDQGRSKSKKCSEAGTTFTGEIVLTQEEYNTILDKVKSIIVPNGVTLKVNGIEVDNPNIKTSFETTFRSLCSYLKLSFWPSPINVLQKIRFPSKVTCQKRYKNKPTYLIQSGIPSILFKICNG